VILLKCFTGGEELQIKAKYVYLKMNGTFRQPKDFSVDHSQIIEFEGKPDLPGDNEVPDKRLARFPRTFDPHEFENISGLKKVFEKSIDDLENNCTAVAEFIKSLLEGPAGSVFSGHNAAAVGQEARKYFLPASAWEIMSNTMKKDLWVGIADKNKYTTVLSVLQTPDGKLVLKLVLYQPYISSRHWTMIQQNAGLSLERLADKNYRRLHVYRENGGAAFEEYSYVVKGAGPDVEYDGDVPPTALEYALEPEGGMTTTLWAQVDRFPGKDSIAILSALRSGDDSAMRSGITQELQVISEKILQSQLVMNMRLRQPSFFDEYVTRFLSVDGPAKQRIFDEILQMTKNAGPQELIDLLDEVLKRPIKGVNLRDKIGFRELFLRPTQGQNSLVQAVMAPVQTYLTNTDIEEQEKMMDKNKVDGMVGDVYLLFLAMEAFSRGDVLLFEQGDAKGTSSYFQYLVSEDVVGRGNVHLVPFRNFVSFADTLLHMLVGVDPSDAAHPVTLEMVKKVFAQDDKKIVHASIVNYVGLVRRLRENFRAWGMAFEEQKTAAPVEVRGTVEYLKSLELLEQVVDRAQVNLDWFWGPKDLEGVDTYDFLKKVYTRDPGQPLRMLDLGSDGQFLQELVTDRFKDEVEAYALDIEKFRKLNVKKKERIDDVEVFGLDDIAEGDPEGVVEKYSDALKFDIIFMNAPDPDGNNIQDYVQEAAAFASQNALVMLRLTRMDRRHPTHMSNFVAAFKAAGFDFLPRIDNPPEDYPLTDFINGDADDRTIYVFSNQDMRSPSDRAERVFTAEERGKIELTYAFLREVALDVKEKIIGEGLEGSFPLFQQWIRDNEHKTDGELLQDPERMTEISQIAEKMIMPFHHVVAAVSVKQEQGHEHRLVSFNNDGQMVVDSTRVGEDLLYDLYDKIRKLDYIFGFGPDWINFVKEGSALDGHEIIGKVKNMQDRYAGYLDVLDDIIDPQRIKDKSDKLGIKVDFSHEIKGFSEAIYARFLLPALPVIVPYAAKITLPAVVYFDQMKNDQLREDSRVLALSEDEIGQLEAQYPQYDWRNAAEVLWPELVRDKDQEIGDQRNYFGNQVHVRRDLLFIIRDLFSGDLSDKDFIERMTMMHIDLITKTGVYPIRRTKGLGGESFALAVAGYLTGPGKERMVELKGLIEALISPVMLEKTMEEISVDVGKFYASLFRWPHLHVFVRGNHAWLMQIVNTMLRLYHFNKGLAHGHIDKKPPDDRSIIIEQIVRSIKDANPGAGASVNRSIVDAKLLDEAYVDYFAAVGQAARAVMKSSRPWAEQVAVNLAAGASIADQLLLMDMPTAYFVGRYYGLSMDHLKALEKPGYISAQGYKPDLFSDYPPGSDQRKAFDIDGFGYRAKFRAGYAEEREMRSPSNIVAAFAYEFDAMGISQVRVETNAHGSPTLYFEYRGTPHTVTLIAVDDITEHKNWPDELHEVMAGKIDGCLMKASMGLPGEYAFANSYLQVITDALNDGAVMLSDDIQFWLAAPEEKPMPIAALGVVDMNITSEIVDKVFERRRFNEGFKAIDHENLLWLKYGLLLNLRQKTAPSANAGGIDLTPGNNGLNVQSTGSSVSFSFDEAVTQRFQNAAGITPVILDIHPMTMSLPTFLGISDNVPAQEMVLR